MVSIKSDDLIEIRSQQGKDGVITVEQSEGIETQLEIAEGMQFDQGYLSPTFVTDPVHREAMIENPYILIYEKKISGMQELLPLLEAAAKKGGRISVSAFSPMHSLRHDNYPRSRQVFTNALASLCRKTDPETCCMVHNQSSE